MIERSFELLELWVKSCLEYRGTELRIKSAREWWSWIKELQEKAE